MKCRTVIDFRHKVSDTYCIMKELLAIFCCCFLSAGVIEGCNLLQATRDVQQHNAESDQFMEDYIAGLKTPRL